MLSLASWKTLVNAESVAAVDDASLEACAHVNSFANADTRTGHYDDSVVAAAVTAKDAYWESATVTKQIAESVVYNAEATAANSATLGDNDAATSFAVVDVAAVTDTDHNNHFPLAAAAADNDGCDSGLAATEWTVAASVRTVPIHHISVRTLARATWPVDELPKNEAATPLSRRRAEEYTVVCQVQQTK